MSTNAFLFCRLQRQRETAHTGEHYVTFTAHIRRRERHLPAGRAGVIYQQRLVEKMSESVYAVYQVLGCPLMDQVWRGHKVRSPDNTVTDPATPWVFQTLGPLTH